MRAPRYAIGFFLFLAASSASAQPTCSFYSALNEDTSYFVLQLSDDYASTTNRPIRVTLKALSPEVFLLYPSEIAPYKQDSFFAGKYKGAGEFRFQATRVLQGPDEILSKTDEFTLAFPAKGAALTKDALKKFLSAQVNECERVLQIDPHSAFHQYVRLLASRRAALPAGSETFAPAGRWRRILDREVDMFSITTGALAVQESLQLEEMLRPRTQPTPQDEADIPIAQLAGPAIKSHPFEKMMEGRTPRHFESATLVPQDFYYVHFNKLDDVLRTLDFVDTWGGHMLRTYGVSGKDDRLAKKVKEQLLLQVDPIVTRLIGRIVNDVTLIGSDPFVLSGTDVTVLMRTLDAKAMQAFWEGKVADAAKRHPNLEQRKMECEGIPVSVALLPSGEIQSYYATWGEWTIISNSPVAIQRVLAVATKKAPSLADAADFRYMRTIFPAPSQEEARLQNSEKGFLYLSDSHIRKLVGPELKIKELRRMQCVNHQKMIEHAALLYRIENLRYPASLDELVEKDYLDSFALECPDGGSYSLASDSLMASCAAHGRLRYLAPNLESPLADVTQKEAGAYRAFVSNYNNYWRQYFDPIGMRIKVGDNVSFETCILPLIDTSMYNNLSAYCGGEAVNLAAPIVAPGTAYSIVARLNPNQIVERFDSLLSLQEQAGLNIKQALPRAIGPTFSFHVLDAEPILSFDINTYLGEVLRWRMDQGFMFLPALAIVNLPAYASVQIQDTKTFEGLRTALETHIARKSAEFRPGRFTLRNDFYRLPDYKGKPVSAVGLELLAFKTRIFYSMTDGFLYIANRPELLYSILDASDKPQPDPIMGNVMMTFHCRNWRAMLPPVELRWEEKSRKACMGNFIPLGTLFQAKPSDEPIGQFAWRTAGRAYTCPDGGKYEYRNGEVSCSAHGTPDNPRQASAPASGNRLAGLLNANDAIRISLRFTPEGIMTRLEAERSK